MKINFFNLFFSIFFLIPNFALGEIANTSRKVNTTALDMINLELAINVVDKKGLFEGIGAGATSPSCKLWENGKGECF